jgi:hypothetical protein
LLRGRLTYEMKIQNSSGMKKAPDSGASVLW